VCNSKVSSSTEFFSDCNTFATPTDSIFIIVESFDKKIGRSYRPILLAIEFKIDYLDSMVMEDNAHHHHKLAGSHFSIILTAVFASLNDYSVVLEKRNEKFHLFKSKTPNRETEERRGI
jgi:hypothetical protein